MAHRHLSEYPGSISRETRVGPAIDRGIAAVAAASVKAVYKRFGRIGGRRNSLGALAIGRLAIRHLVIGQSRLLR